MNVIPRRVLGTAVLIGAALFASACGSTSKTSSPAVTSKSPTASSTSTSSSTTTASSASHKFTVALVPGDTTDPFYLSMKLAGKTEATKLGMGFIWEGGSTFSPEAQAPVLSALLARHPSALIVAPTDPVALTSILKQYKAAGIPVITVDTTINDRALLTSRITSDNLQGGATAAAACGKAMHGTGDAAVIYTTPGTTTTNARGQGFIATMKKDYPKVTVLTEYDNNDETTATTQVSSLLLGHPNLACIFGTNDYAAEGAAQAVDTAHDKSKVTIAGYDAEPQMVSLLKAGTIQIIIAQKPAIEAQTAVEYAYDALTGKTSAITKTVKLSNVLMTTKNISNPNIAKWIYKG